MDLWIAVGLITLAVSVYLLRPLIRGGSSGVRRGDFDLSVYRQQLSELDADQERGVISGPEAEAARVEIQRRMIQTGRDAEAAAEAGGSSRLVVGVVVAILLPAAAAALYMSLGSPNLPSQPLAERGDIPGRPQVAQAGGGAPAGGAGQEGLASIEKMVESLSERLQGDPTDFDGWMLLGRSYGVMEAYDKAAEAYARAAALPEGFNDPNAQMQLGETIIFASQGIVTERAQTAFRRALEIDPRHPGAQFYLALARGQAGNLQGAYEGWLALAAESPADAPWMPALRARLQEVARDLDIELPDPLPTLPAGPAQATPPVAQAPAPSASAPATASRPAAPAGPIAGTRGPDAEQMRAAAEMSADDRQEMIRGMVQRLADRMAENPDDADGWNRLARAYGVLGDQSGAVEAYGNLVRLNPDDVQARLSLGGAYLALAGPGPMPVTAIEQFEAVLALDASNPDALWFLGRADAEAGRNDAAREKWQRLLGQLQPGSEAHGNVSAQIQRLGEG